MQSESWNPPMLSTVNVIIKALPHFSCFETYLAKLLLKRLALEAT